MDLGLCFGLLVLLDLALVSWCLWKVLVLVQVLETMARRGGAGGKHYAAGGVV